MSWEFEDGLAAPAVVKISPKITVNVSVRAGVSSEGLNDEGCF